MSLLYKDKKDITHKVIVKQDDGRINMLFEANCGKFGTDETLDEYNLTIKELLEILQTHDAKFGY